MFRISTNTPQVKERPQGGTGDIKEILKNLKAAGFDTYDFTMSYSANTYDVFFDKDDYIERAKDLRKFADELGMVCNQTHSIFPVYRENESKEFNERNLIYAKRCIEITSILGAGYTVVHPMNSWSDEQNVALMQSLLPTAHKENVKICLENMWNWDEKLDHAVDAACSNHISFRRLVDMCNDDYVAACLDIGHAYMRGLNTDGVKMIKALGPRLHCLHIHDNNCHHDQHQLPFTHSIPFQEVLDALAEINYKGDITFECDYYIMSLPKEVFVEGMRTLHSIGEYFKKELIKRESK